MLWSLAVLVGLGLVVWLLRGPGNAPMGRAFRVLAIYGGLFCLSLLKVWWTAGYPAVVLDGEGLAYQPLHAFRRRAVRFDRILACAPRQDTHSLRVIHQWSKGRARELFLNLAVIDGRHDLLDRLGERLLEAGLEPLTEYGRAWCRPGHEDLVQPESIPRQGTPDES